MVVDANRVTCTDALSVLGCQAQTCQINGHDLVSNLDQVKGCVVEQPVLDLAVNQGMQAQGGGFGWDTQHFCLIER